MQEPYWKTWPKREGYRVASIEREFHPEFNKHQWDEVGGVENPTRFLTRLPNLEKLSLEPHNWGSVLHKQSPGWVVSGYAFPRDVVERRRITSTDNKHSLAEFGYATKMRRNHDDLVVNMSEMPSLLQNDGGNLRNWIKLKLIGTQCNRTSIGARVRIVTGKHAQLDEVQSGSSVMSQSDLRLHFGSGQAQTVDLIEVKWPTTQKIERFTQVKANQILTIREGSGMVKK